MAFEISVGGSLPVITETPPPSTGLAAVYVAWIDGSQAEVILEGVNSGVTVSRYKNMGGGYAEPVETRALSDASVSFLTGGDCGYIVNDGGRDYCFWIVNYAASVFNVTSVASTSTQTCDNTMIDIAGSGDVLRYYSIDGRPCELSRDIQVKCLNLQWDDDAENFIQREQVKILGHLTPTVQLTPALMCTSRVEVTGDRFLEAWGRPVSIESAPVTPNGISVETKASQEDNTVTAPDSGDEGGATQVAASNIIKGEGQGLGGSAPAEISFSAYVTDAVVHNEWQIASDPEFEYVMYRFTEQDLDYTFDEEGEFYVRFVGSNGDGSCEAYSEVYNVSIGSSELRIPNAFTPNGDGINDEWKVAYRSLLSFKCSIFDRYGNPVKTFTDPNEGWDGKHNGKTVKSGVYFYVIEAVGADGKRYKKGGDINIIISKRGSSAIAE